MMSVRAKPSTARARRAAGLVLAGVAAAWAAGARAAPDEGLARALLSELVAINTAPSGGGDMREAVALLAARLREAGFAADDITIAGQSELLPNLVVRYRSPEPRARPVLTMAHLDVVEGLASDWSYPPYQLTEDDGWLYGRGTSDNKAGAAILVGQFHRPQAGRLRAEPRYHHDADRG